MSSEFGTLTRSDRSHGDGADSAADSLARAVPALFRPSRAAARAADLRARCIQRQRSEVDAGDVGPRDAADHLPSLSTFHHARGLGRGRHLAAPSRRTARAQRRIDHRRDQFPQTGDPFGRRRAPVLWCARQDRQLPSRNDSRAVDRSPRVADGRAVVSAEARGSRTPIGVRSRRFRPPCRSKRSGDRRSH